MTPAVPSSACAEPLAARTVHALIERQAQARPQAVYALEAEGPHVIRFAELSVQCRQVNALLTHHGSQPGDTLSLVMPNGLHTLRLLLGAMHGGWCVNPVNLLSSTEQLHYVLDHSDCRVVFCTAERLPQVRKALQNVERTVAVVVCEADDTAALLPPPADDAPAPSPDRLALLMYTSGTTGLPKGVMLTQANLAANAEAISSEHGLGPTDRVLAVLPLYHINAFAVTMLAPLAHGGSLTMPPRFSAASFWSLALERQCTWLNVVPTMISYLLEGSAPEREALSHLRFCRSASAALPMEHLHAFERRFGIGIIETMGLTETVAPAFSNPLVAAQRKPGAVGRPSGCQARVIDASMLPVADGVTGEITIRGPQVMQGYYKNPLATQAAFTHDGWLRTGDLGYRDADGFFFVTGRIKELIIKGGENIAPREIDEVLLRHPAVLDAACTGVADRHFGQDIMACVILREGHPASEAELLAFCESMLGRYKAPKTLHLVSELPRGPSGKVQRLRLVEWVQGLRVGSP
jgi:acyl-CoA synthetase (AMP-forming)/AMP-acid ligase II